MSNKKTIIQSFNCKYKLYLMHSIACHTVQSYCISQSISLSLHKAATSHTANSMIHRCNSTLSKTSWRFTLASQLTASISANPTPLSWFSCWSAVASWWTSRWGWEDPQCQRCRRDLEAGSTGELAALLVALLWKDTNHHQTLDTSQLQSLTTIRHIIDTRE